MKPFTRNMLICFVLLVPLYFAGGRLYSWLLETQIPHRVSVGDMGGPFFASIVFGFVAALIPFALVFCWKFGPVTGKRKRLYSVLIFVICAMLGLLVRVGMVRRQLKYADIPGFENYQALVPFEMLKFESYFFGGTIAGFLIVWFVLRDKKKQAST
jgi:hypothetical protein